MNVIPAIDLRGGRCVRLLKGDYDRETRYSDDPVSVAESFRALGFERLHLVDLDGARSGEQQHQAVVRRIVAETGMTVQLGGGVRDRTTVAGWLEQGVDRVVVGSVAVRDPAAVRDWLAEFGTERIVLALDVRMGQDGVPALATDGWTRDSGLSLWACLDAYRDAGLRHVLCTDVSRDGAMAGPNLALYRQFVDCADGLRLQASGGVRGIDDLEALRQLGADAAITGRALLDGAISHEEIRRFRQDA